MTYTGILPRILHSGAGASARIPQILASLGCQRLLIITGRMMVQLGYAKRIRSALAEAGLPCDVFADTLPEPTVAAIQSGVAKAAMAVWSKSLSNQLGKYSVTVNALQPGLLDTAQIRRLFPATLARSTPRRTSRSATSANPRTLPIWRPSWYPRGRAT